MRLRRAFRLLAVSALLLPPLVCSAAAFSARTRPAQTPSAPAQAQPTPAQKPRPAATEARMLQPSDFFADFPDIRWGMKFQDAWKAVEKSGAQPVRLAKEIENELAWTGKFNGIEGRAAVHLLREGEGVTQITVGVYAMEKLPEVSGTWRKRVTERHGEPQLEDGEYATEHLWRLKDGFVILLRTMKDENNPVVEIRWVKE